MYKQDLVDVSSKCSHIYICRNHIKVEFSISVVHVNKQTLIVKYC